MAITREKKEELLEQYKGQVEEASAIVFTDFRGLSVSQIQSLRTKLIETGATYTVVKNSILGLALEQLGRERPEELLAGPTAVAFLGEDIGTSVTALKDWFRIANVGRIDGAIIESATLDAAGATALADLPTKDQVLSMILGVLSAPSGNLVRTINAPASSLVRVLNAHVEKQQEAA